VDGLDFAPLKQFLRGAYPHRCFEREFLEKDDELSCGDFMSSVFLVFLPFHVAFMTEIDHGAATYGDGLSTPYTGDFFYDVPTEITSPYPL